MGTTQAEAIKQICLRARIAKLKKEIEEMEYQLVNVDYNPNDHNVCIRTQNEVRRLQKTLQG